MAEAHDTGFLDRVRVSQLGEDINNEAAGPRIGNRVALSADGKVVAIGAPYNDGNGEYSGHVRLYSVVLASLDIDGDGEAKALTDGLMIIRRLFGFSGTSLTAGALSETATITESADIATYIDSLVP